VRLRTTVVSGDPIVVLFRRFERRRFLRPYSSAEIYLNFFPVDFVAAVVGATRTLRCCSKRRRVEISLNVRLRAVGVGDQRQVGLAISDGERARIVGRADDSGDRNDVP
jgi:hypothetical protein